MLKRAILTFAIVILIGVAFLPSRTSASPLAGPLVTLSKSVAVAPEQVQYRGYYRRHYRRAYRRAYRRHYY